MNECKTSLPKAPYSTFNLRAGTLRNALARFSVELSAQTARPVMTGGSRFSAVYRLPYRICAGSNIP